jgi:hypothetical protein
VHEAVDQTDFNTQLASGIFNLATWRVREIVLDGSSGALTTFLIGGGKVLGATWLNGSMAASRCGDRCEPEPDRRCRALFNGVSSPIQTNRGWGIFSRLFRRRRLHGELLLRVAAQVGNGGHTLLLDRCSTRTTWQRR